MFNGDGLGSNVGGLKKHLNND